MLESLGTSTHCVGIIGFAMKSVPRHRSADLGEESTDSVIHHRLRYILRTFQLEVAKSLSHPVFGSFSKGL